MARVAIGGGAGFAGDRPDAAGRLAVALRDEPGRGFLVLELLAERTLAEAQLARAQGGTGHSPRLMEFLEAVAGPCQAGDVAIVTNGGGADPEGAAREARRLLGPEIRIAAVTGDDLMAAAQGHEPARRALEAMADGSGELVSANVYLGAAPVAAALAGGTEVVIAGRVADPSLAVACAVHGLGWPLEPGDAAGLDRLAAATLAGHLIECGAQATGGFFADPGFKDVPGAHNPGLPIARLDASGRLELGKPAGSGGRLDRRTVIEQLLYEVHDPAAYLTPDLTLNLTEATVTETGRDRVAVAGARGRPRPPTLKAIAGYRHGWTGEAEISYAGPGAAARALLAAEILGRRLPPDAVAERRVDVIGLASLFNDRSGVGLAAAATLPRPSEDLRLRLAVWDEDRRRVEHAVLELESLYTNGPAGGGGVRRWIDARLVTRAFLVPRDAVMPRVVAA